MTAARAPVSERLWLGLIVVAMATAYALIGLFKHWHFDTSLDLGIFDQAVWHASRFEIPASTISGYRNILGDHFYPIVFLLVLPYWIVPAAGTLIVAQAILVAASIIPVFVFLRRRLTSGLAFGMVIAYAVFWGLQRTVNADVHEMAFAPLVIAGLVLAMDSKRWGWLWICCFLLICTKEDLIPLVAGVGAYMYWLGERRYGIALFAFGLLAYVAVVNVVIPSFSGGWSTSAAYQTVWKRPWTALTVIVTPPQKLLTVVAWLAPFCFLSLWSPLALLIFPIAISRLLSTVSIHWGWTAHYTAPLAPLLAMSAGDGLSRLMRTKIGATGRRNALPVALVGLSVLLAFLIPGHQPILRLFTRGHYAVTVDRGVAGRALALIPPDASVVAQAGLVPHLSQRSKVYVLSAAAPDADYLVASKDLNAWPMSGPGEIAELIEQRRSHGYVTIFDESGWIVLHLRP